MTFLSPANLWTLAALVLPLAIHLWRRPPRTVRLGSLRFLQTGARRLQDLRWREYALLATRLCLLTVLGLGLARPLWRQPPSIRPVRWALLDPAAAPAGPSLDRLRALQAAGSEMRLLAPAFPLIHATPADPTAAASDLWSLLREADATLPAGSSLAVFSPGRLASLRGVRPSLARVRVDWTDTPAAPAPPSLPPASPPTPPPLTILILHAPDRAEDARYVSAALHALSQAGPRPLTVTVTPLPAAASPTPVADWTFWLADQPVPTALAAHAANLLSDAPADAATNSAPGWIIPQPGVSGPPVRLWRRALFIEGSPVWTDETGAPLLTLAHGGHGAHWRFGSRFHPAWNDLPLGPALPASLRGLLAGPFHPPVAATNPSLADPSQCLPSDRPATVAAPLLAPPEVQDDPSFLWKLAALLFGLERFLSHRRAPRPAAPAEASSAAAAQPAMSR